MPGFLPTDKIHLSDLPLGVRFLYQMPGSDQVREGVLLAYSPSGKWAKLGARWEDAYYLQILELLPSEPSAAPGLTPAENSRKAKAKPGFDTNETRITEGTYYGKYGK
jgi:hypothetical protein